VEEVVGKVMSGGCRLEQMEHENERQRRTGGRDGE